MGSELRPHWRKGKIDLPEHTKKINTLWFRHPRLPDTLQRMGRKPQIPNYIVHERHEFRKKIRRERNRRRALNRAPKVAERTEAIRLLQEAKDKEEEAWKVLCRGRRMKEMASIQVQRGLLMATSSYFETYPAKAPVDGRQIDSGPHMNQLDNENPQDLRLMDLLSKNSEETVLSIESSKPIENRFGGGAIYDFAEATHKNIGNTHKKSETM